MINRFLTVCQLKIVRNSYELENYKDRLFNYINKRHLVKEKCKSCSFINNTQLLGNKFIIEHLQEWL